MIDLTGGEVKVIGNSGDKHIFKLSNPNDQDIINSEGEYQAEFFTSYKNSSTVPVELDESEVAWGALLFEVVITSGFYRIKRLSPLRTLITIEVEIR